MKNFLFFLSITVLSSSASTIVTSIDGSFKINESVGSFGVEYRVDILDSSNIAAMAISYVEDGTDSLEAFGDIGIFQNSWNTAIITETQWNDSSTFYSVFTGPGLIDIYTASLGSFDSLFGTADNRVAFYYSSFSDFLNESTDSDELDWASGALPTFTRDEFVPSSEAITIGTDGTILSMSIPEPSSTILIGLAFVGTIFRRDKKRG